MGEQRFDSIEEAVGFVKSFWRTMPHVEMITLPDEDDVDSWTGELTAHVRGGNVASREGVLSFSILTLT